MVFPEVVFLEGLGMVDGAGISLGGGSDMEGGHWPTDLGFTDVDILETVGGVGGGESNLGDAELEIFPVSFCFFIDAAFLPRVVPSISTSSKVRSAPKSARASIAMVTLPWTRNWAKCSREEVLEGNITVIALELQ